MIDLDEMNNLDWEALFDSTDLLITVHDKDFSVIKANRAAREKFGLSESKCSKIKCYEMFHGTDHPPEYCPSLKSLKTRQIAVAEIYEPLHNCFMEMKSIPRFNGSNELSGFFHVSRDISKRKALEESESRYLFYVKNFKGIAFRGHLNFIPIFFHGSVEEITGYTEKELLSGNPSWDKIVYKDDFHILQNSTEKFHTVPDFSVEREYRIVRKDGELRWLFESIQNICDDSM
ncbi:hypothetical protein LCGC14_2163660, partial [marine sediment metagenome]